MPLSDKDREKLAFDHEYKKMVQSGVELKRWKPDILGPVIPDYRESPAGPEVANTLEIIQEFLTSEANKHGITEADFWMDVRKHFGAEQKTAKRADEINFYDQMENEVEVRRDIEHKRINLAGKKVKYPIHKIFQKTLRRFGFYPKYKGQFLKVIPKIGFGRKIKGEYKGEKTDVLGNELIPENFEEIEKQIQEKNQEIVEIDEQLVEYADKISALDAELGRNPDDDEQERILSERKVIHSKISRLTDMDPLHMTVGGVTKTKKTVTEEALKLEQQQNLILLLIKDELEKEAKVIDRKWGKKVKALIRKKQNLLVHLDKLVNGGKDAQIAKLRVELRNIDLELIELKKKIIDHKSKRPIFLYERFVGVQSIPVLKPKGQSSTILGGMEMPAVKGPPHKIPRKQ